MPITTNDVGYLQGLLQAFKTAEVRDKLIFFTDEVRHSIVKELEGIIVRASKEENAADDDAMPSTIQSPAAPQGQGSSLQSLIDAKIIETLSGGDTVENPTPDQIRQQFLDTAEAMKKQMDAAEETRAAYKQIIEDFKSILSPDEPDVAETRVVHTVESNPTVATSAT